MPRTAVILITTLSFMSAARASEEGPPIVEPMAFEGIAPTEHGELEVQFAAEGARAEEGVVLEPTARLFYGLLPGFSLELGTRFIVELGEAQTRGGLGDIELGAKLALLESTSGFRASTLLEVVLPTSSVDGEGGAVGASLGFVLSARSLTLQGRAGAELGLRALETTLAADLSLAVDTIGGLCVLAEAGGEIAVADAAAHLHAGPAVRWTIIPGFWLGAGALVGMTESTEPIRLIAKAQYAF